MSELYLPIHPFLPMDAQLQTVSLVMHHGKTMVKVVYESTDEAKTPAEKLAPGTRKVPFKYFKIPG